MKEVKTLFPTMGKEEKTYVKNLEVSIEDCIEESHLDSMKALYDTFGTPADVRYSILACCLQKSSIWYALSYATLFYISCTTLLL